MLKFLLIFNIYKNILKIFYTHLKKYRKTLYLINLFKKFYKKLHYLIYILFSSKK